MWNTFYLLYCQKLRGLIACSCLFINWRNSLADTVHVLSFQGVRWTSTSTVYVLNTSSRWVAYLSTQHSICSPKNRFTSTPEAQILIPCINVIRLFWGVQRDKMHNTAVKLLQCYLKVNYCVFNAFQFCRKRASTTAILYFLIRWVICQKERRHSSTAHKSSHKPSATNLSGSFSGVTTIIAQQALNGSRSLTALAHWWFFIFFSICFLFVW